MRVHNLRNWFRLALVLLVSACPCALVLSTPVATFCALNRAATTGLLVKGGDYLEALAQTKTVAFDKTGTLTRGEFTVMDFQSVTDGISMETLLYWVSSIESKSSHPMASALVNHARLKSIHPRPDNVRQFQIFPGAGIYGEVDGNGVYIGSQRIALRAGCKTGLNLEEKTNGMTVIYVFSNEVLVGLFSLSDTCRTGAVEAIKDLKKLGNKVVMLTGDSWGSASTVQRQLANSIDIVHAELLPEDKVRIVHDLKSRGGSVVMVGDGMNDAPALTAADVGISMGISGSAVAMETSHVTLMSNDVRKIPEAIKLAKKTKWKIIENVILSMLTKAAIVALAFAGHPLLWAAVLADVGTCLLVVFNSMLLLRKNHRAKKCCSSHHVSHMHSQAEKHSTDHSHEDSCCKSQMCHESSGADGACHVKDPKVCAATTKDCCNNGGFDNVLASVADFHKSSCFLDESDEHHHHHHHHHHSVPDVNCQSEIVLDSGKHKGKQGHGHHHHYDEELAASRCCPNEKKESCQAGSGGSSSKPATCTAASVCSDFHMHSTPDGNSQKKVILDSGEHKAKQGHGHHHHYDEELAMSRCCPNEKKESSHAGCRSSSSTAPATCSAPTDCSESHVHAGFYKRGGGTCCRVECMRESCCGSPDHAISC